MLKVKILNDNCCNNKTGLSHPKIIIVTGTPGVGKSSISRLLSSKINANLLSLGELVKKEGLFKVLDQDTYIADMEKVAERVQELLRGSTLNWIIEGHYAVHVVHSKNVYLTFVLRRNPKELSRVLHQRNYNKQKIYENLAAEILDVCLYDAIAKYDKIKVCEVNVSGKKLDEVLGEMLDIINGKRDCTVGRVDWLGTLEAEGKLDEYLKEF